MLDDKLSVTPDKILITGASGFVGKVLASEFQSDSIVLMSRNHFVSDAAVVVSPWGSKVDFTEKLRGARIVIHLAGLAHQKETERAQDIDLYREVNASATRQLALCAARAGVKHFIFLSTVKVNGETTSGRSPFRANDTPNPHGAYAKTKAEAEEGLLDIARDFDLVVSIIRAPLVYGPGVKGNFASLLRYVEKRIPFPYSPHMGRRSLVSVWNLCSFIKQLVNHPPSSSAIYMISDDSDLTSFDIFTQLASATQNPSIGLRLPLCLIRTVFFVVGKSGVYKKLFESAQVDIAPTIRATGWQPLHNTRVGLESLAREIKS